MSSLQKNNNEAHKKLQNVSERLQKLQQETNYNIKQINGQRVFGPPPSWNGLHPPRGSEIFMGQLPRDVFEDEYVPLCTKVGPLFEMRLMMDFSGSNRGFGFVTYFSPQVANKAIKMLHGYEIRAGHKITVYKSIDNRQLFISGIPRHKTKDQVRKAFHEFFSGIKDVIMYLDNQDRTKNRGFAFVTFKNHRMAVDARKAMWPSLLYIWGVHLSVEWAIPAKKQNYSQTMIRLTNLDLSATQNDIRKLLCCYFQSSSVINIIKKNSSAIVRFPSAKHAREAYKKLKGVRFFEKKIKASYCGFRTRKGNRKRKNKSIQQSEQPTSIKNEEVCIKIISN